MKRIFQGVLVLGLALPPKSSQAQYMAPNYYAQPRPMYAPAYGYGWQPAPAYPRAYPYGWQPAPAAYYRPYPQPQYVAPVYSYTSPVYVQASHYANQAPMQLAAPIQSGPVQSAPVQSAPIETHAPVVESTTTDATLPPAETVHEGTPDAASGKPAPNFVAWCKKKKLKHGETKSCADGACDECKKPKYQKFQVFYDPLHWNFHNAAVPFAQAFDGVDPQLSVPRGPVGVADPNFRDGFRGGAGIAVSEKAWIIGTYTYFENGILAHIEAPEPFVLHSNLVYPNTTNAAFTPLKADADYNIRHTTGDIDFKYTFIDDGCLRVSWLGGGRYGQLNQNLQVRYDELLGSETIETRVKFEGAGPRAGFEADYRVKYGFYGYGKGMLNLLAGRFSASFEQRDIFGGLVARSEIFQKRLVPIPEMEVGGGWEGFKGHLRISGGYFVGSWLNTLTTNAFVRGVQNNDFTSNSDNFKDTLTFDGVVGHIELRY